MDRELEPPLDDFMQTIKVIGDELIRVSYRTSVSLSNVLKNVSSNLRQEQQHNGQAAHLNLHVAISIVQFDLYRKCSDNDKLNVLDLLIRSQEDTLLHWISYDSLGNLLPNIDLIEFKRIAFPLLESTLSTPWEEQTLTTLYLLMVVQGVFPECIPASFLENNLGTFSIVCPESLDYLCELLMRNLEFTHLAESVYKMLSKTVSASDLVEQFFAKLDLIMTLGSHRQYFIITTLVTGVLQYTKNPEVIPKIFTKRYLEQAVVMSLPSNGTPELPYHDLTLKLYKTLVSSLKKKSTSPEIVIEVIRKLVFNRKLFVTVKNEYNTAVHIILEILNIEGIKEMSDILKNYILEANGECPHKMYNTASLLMELMDYPVMNGESAWKIDLLIFVGKRGLLKDQSDGNLQSSAFLLTETFYSFLHFKMSKYHDIGNIISKVLNEFIKVIGGGNWNVLRRPLKQKYHRTWQKAVEIITDLDGSLHDRDIVVHYLCSLFCLQLFSNAKLASGCLSEVFSCYESTKNPTDFEDETRIWLEIVDLFLTLLSHDCWLMLDLIKHVFPVVCKYIDSTLLYQILYPLDPDMWSSPASEETDSVDDDDSENEEELLVSNQQGGYPTRWESIQHYNSVDPNKGYRIRILSLIQIHLKLNPSMLPSLEIMSTLMRLLHFCVESGNLEDELLKEVRECLKLFPLLPFNDSKDVTEEFLVELLTKLFYYLKSEPAVAQNMSEAIVDCSIYVLKCSQHLNIVAVENSENVQKTNLMKHAVQGFFMSGSPMLYNVLKKLFQCSWNRVQVFSLLPKVFRFAFARLTYRRRDQALKLAKLFFGNRQYIDSHLEQMKAIEKDIVSFLGDCGFFFRKLSREPAKRRFEVIGVRHQIYAGKRSTRDKFTCDLVQLLYDMKTSALGGLFQSWPVLQSDAAECRDSYLSPETLAALNTFCS